MNQARKLKSDTVKVQIMNRMMRAFFEDLKVTRIYGWNYEILLQLLIGRLLNSLGTSGNKLHFSTCQRNSKCGPEIYDKVSLVLTNEQIKPLILSISNRHRHTKAHRMTSRDTHIHSHYKYPR